MEDYKTLTKTLLGSREKGGSFDKLPYGDKIANLIHLMIGTSPDLASTLSKLLQYCEAPTQKHWNEMKRIMRYVKGMLRPGISFSGPDAL